MSSMEWLIALVPIAYAIISILIVGNKKLKIGLDAAVVGVVFTLVFSLYYEKFPQLERAAGLERGLVQDNVVFKTFQKANDVSHQISGIGDATIKKIFYDQLRRQLVTTVDLLSDLAAEKAIIAKQDANNFASTVINSAQKSVDATSFVDPKNWWISPSGTLSQSGESYLKLNQVAVARGIKIRRVFILKSIDERAALKLALEASKKAGVETYIAYADQIDASYRQDFLVVDEKLAGELILDPETRRYERFEVTYSPDRVPDFLQRMQHILGGSERY